MLSIISEVFVKGKYIDLTQNPYREVYKGRICFFARGFDIDMNFYLVRWDTKPEWEKAQRANPNILMDKTNACDWDNPVDLELL